MRRPEICLCCVWQPHADDSGAEQLKHVCVGVSVALALCIALLFWVMVAWKSSIRQKGKEGPTGSGDGSVGTAARVARGQAGPNHNNSSSGEETRTGSPDSQEVDDKIKKQVSHLSLRSLRSFKSLDNMEMQPRS